MLSPLVRLVTQAGLTCVGCVGVPHAGFNSSAVDEVLAVTWGELLRAGATHSTALTCEARGMRASRCGCIHGQSGWIHGQSGWIHGQSGWIHGQSGWIH
eukprot:702265-Prorocentrum_minimum.AAC.1